MIDNNGLFKCQEMFRYGCIFSECADMANSKLAHDTADLGFYTSPAVVNSAFSCEVFLKSLLDYYDQKYKKTHKLNLLFDSLPKDIQEWVQHYVLSHCGQWYFPMMANARYLDLCSNAFEEWRYGYEIKGCMEIQIGFLLSFRNALREKCCQLFFKKQWNQFVNP